MGKTKQKAIKRPKVWKKEEKEAFEMIAREPELPLIEIGRKLQEKQLISKPEQIYNIARANRKSGQEITQIREKNSRTFHEEIVPLALKREKRILKDKNIDDLDAFPAVKLALDKAFGGDETRQPYTPAQINIETLQIYNARRAEVLEGKD